MNYIDLFAGAGGLSEGFINAGFVPIAHVESDKAACFTLRTRLSYHYLLQNNNKDIYNSYLKGEISRDQLYSNVPQPIFDTVINLAISEENNDVIFNKIDNIAGTEEIDLIIGGPPCQGYSNIGRSALKHKINDPRKKLYIEYGKFLIKYKPKLFIFENVPGLKTSDDGVHYRDIYEYFRSIGYVVEDKLLNALDFGVIQDRKRLIIIGWRDDSEFNYPIFEKDHNVPNSNDIFFDLPPLNPGEGSRYCSYMCSANEYLRESGIRGQSENILTQHITRQHNEKDLRIYEEAVSLYRKGVYIKNNLISESIRTQQNTKDFLDRFKVVGKIPHTLIAHIAKDGHHYIYNDTKQNRSISVREAARIQSFPDNYFFEGESEKFSRTASFKQIGNAVPPLMSKKIAVKIEELLNRNN